jgi:hypothetical protein
VTPTSDRPDEADAALFGQVTRRHTERRRMSHRPVPPEILAELADQARRAVRVGWPAGAAGDLPATPRRDLRSVLLPC